MLPCQQLLLLMQHPEFNFKHCKTLLFIFYGLFECCAVDMWKRTCVQKKIWFAGPVHKSDQHKKCLTKAGGSTQVVAILDHRVSQEPFRMGVARGLFLTTDFGYSVGHAELGSNCWVGLKVVWWFREELNQRFACGVSFLDWRLNWILKIRLKTKAELKEKTMGTSKSVFAFYPLEILKLPIQFSSLGSSNLLTHDLNTQQPEEI